MASKNNQNLLISIILIIVLVAIIFLTFKVYNLYTLNTFYKEMDNRQEDIVFESDNVNLIPVLRRNDDRWHFWPSNWSWNSDKELGKNKWHINKYNGPGYQGGVGARRFGNYCPYAGTCPYGEWKGCPYGAGCPGPRLPIEEVTRVPRLHHRFD